VDSEQLRSLIYSNLSQVSKELFDFLPNEIANQLLLDRDPHGNVQVAKI
jgi:pyrophosphate--fructose-6-phosphate 1-phosphotransferase